MNRLNLDKLDTVLGGGRYHNHKDLMAFPDCGRCDLKYPRWLPILKPELKENVSLLRLIQKQDRYIHVPFIVLITISVYFRRRLLVRMSRV